MPVQSPPITISSSELSEQIAIAADSGRGLVPLIGAGVSEAAGIPLARYLPTHLWLCIGMALGLDGEDGPNGIFWHPRSAPWPPMRADWLARAQKCQDRIKEIAEYSLVDDELPDACLGSATTYLDAINVARGCLGDWRLALQFLARLSPEILQRPRIASVENMPSNIFQFKTKDQKALNRVQKVNKFLGTALPNVQLGNPDQNIIDSYFNFITAGRTPTMAHRILVHFRHVLHCKIILSLNFDDLMEQAFLEQGVEPSIYEVHHGSPPPAFSLIGSSPAVIKLHGGHWGVRADISLDQEPSLRERRHFRGYFLGTDWSYSKENESAKHSLNDLLIIGVSGDDGRVRALVEDALEKIHDCKFRVYWCCYSRRDVQQVRSLIEEIEEQGNTNADRPNSADRIVISRIDHLGLALWEIYHRTTRSPVPSGLTFPTSWNVPLAPSSTTKETWLLDADVKTLEQNARKWYSTAQIPVLSLGSARDIAENSSGRAHWGITALGWRLFSEWKSQTNCLWLDLEDLSDHLDFAVRLIQAVETRLGCRHHAPTLGIDPASADRQLKHALAELHSLMARSPARWVLFLNLRSSHGYAADIFARLNSPRNGPTEYLTPKTLETAEIAGFYELIAALIDAKHYSATPGFIRFVLLLRADEFGLEKQLKSVERLCLREPIDASGRDWARKHVSKFLKNLKCVDNDAETRRLRCLAMFPQIRQISSLVTRAIDGTESVGNSSWKSMTEQIDSLISQRIIRSKTGGFLWMHWDVREELQSKMAEKFPLTESHRPDLHISQADWSMTLFESTQDPLAAYQAVYHRCTAAKFLISQLDGESTSNSDGDLSDRSTIRACISEAIKHLERAHASTLAWGHSIDAGRCFRGLSDFLLNLLDWCENDPRTEELVIDSYAKTEILRIALLRDAGRTSEIDALLSRIAASGPLAEERWAQFGKMNPIRHVRITHQLALEKISSLITRRKYRPAHEQLVELLKTECGFPLDELHKLGDTDEIWAVIYRWGHQHPQLEDPNKKMRPLRFDIRILAIQILRRLLELHLLEYEAMLVHHDYRYQQNPDAHELWMSKSVLYYQAARTVQRLVNDGSDPRLLVAMSRIHGIYAGIKAHLGEEQAVQRHLNEAAIGLSRLPESEAHIAETVLQLRRVYCQFQSMLWSARAEDPTEHRKRSRLFEEFERLRATKSRGDGPAPDLRKDILRASAALGAMDSQLEESRSRLANGRKSLWWWVSYARYRMVWYLQREILRKLREESLKTNAGNGSPSNARRVQLEQYNIKLVRRHELESALHLLNGVTRRTIDDSYQLSRIADTCIDMFQIAGNQDHMKDMGLLDKRSFSGALDQIKAIMGKGHSSDKDPNVADYIDKVIAKLSDRKLTGPSAIGTEQTEVDDMRCSGSGGK